MGGILYCLRENQANETFCSKFISCQSLYQQMLQNERKYNVNEKTMLQILPGKNLQNLKTLMTLPSYQFGQNFWNLKKKNQDEPISYSCINLRMKLLIKLQNSPKNRAKMKFYIFWEAVSQFCFRQTLHLFRLHSAPRKDAG